MLNNFAKSGLMAFGLLCAAATASRADVVTQYEPWPADLYDLDHRNAISWGINAPELGNPIIAATLTINNIRDWQIESDDMLYIRLLPTAPLHQTYYEDNEAFGDYFAGQGISLITYADLLPYTPEELASDVGVTLVYNFTPEQLAFLQAYAADGLFGISFDPDCHYINDGIELTVTTTVPEPSTVALMGLGLLGLAGAAVRKRKKA